MGNHIRDVSRCFREHLHPTELCAFSSRLQEQFKEKLTTSDICMLPSYTHGLPNGREQGRFLALDVGGSTLRVAIVQLHGRSRVAALRYSIEQRVFKIDDPVRNLSAPLFFDWIAQAIQQVLGLEDRKACSGKLTMSMGVAWSFPLEQISLRDALLLQMGKAFRVTDTHLRHNLADLIEASCCRLGVDIHVEAIVNDSAAILLAQTYCEGAAGIAYILGTGMNAAIELPVGAFGTSKLGSTVNETDPTAHIASKVVVNTELSMFGGDVFPITPWDIQLRTQLPRPDFQPLEYLSSGRYIGEIVRLALIGGIQGFQLFGGNTPEHFGAYELETSILSGLEGNDLQIRAQAGAELETRHPFANKRTYTASDIQQIHAITQSVSERAAAYVAVSMHALWALKLDLEHQTGGSPEKQVFVSCNGSVIVKYTGFMERVQAFLDLMTGAAENGHQPLVLHVAGREESVLIGAAVAVAAGRSQAAEPAMKERARL